MIIGLATAWLYLVPPTGNTLAMSASFIPYGLPFDLIAVIVFGIAVFRARRRPAVITLVMISVVLLILQVIWIAPQFVADPRPVAGRPFTMISLNMRWGEANVGQLRAEARQADLVVLVEVTPAAFDSVRSGLGRRFPFSVPDRITTGNQSLILSRHPLIDPAPLPSTTEQWTAATTMPGIGRLNVIAAHPCNPMCGGRLWSTEHAALANRALQLDNAPEVVAGDFNATDGHGPMRTLYADGFTSATDIVGAGWMPTFPSDSRVYPPLLEIDHVLVNSRLTVLSINTFRIDGTDHLGLITRLAGTRPG